MSDLKEEDQKRIIKEALKEWLDEKFLAFGYWSVGGVAAAALVALTYFIFKFGEWGK